MVGVKNQTHGWRRRQSSAWYRPDASEQVCLAQQDYTKRIGEQCAKYDIPFLFELLVYPLAADAHQTQEYVEMKGKKADDVLRSVEEFAKPQYGIDVFKLESPVNASDADGSSQVQAIFDEMGRLAGRPWVMLSAGAGKAEFRNVLKHAFKAGAPASWRAGPFGSMPSITTRTGTRLNGICGVNPRITWLKFQNLANAGASNWQQHECYGEGGARFAPADARFRHSYDDV